MELGITVASIALTLGVVIDEMQFSLLITVVVLSAVVATAIAERWFLPPRHEAPAPIPAEEYV